MTRTHKLTATMSKYHFGNVIAKLMQDRNLNQNELAAKSGVDRNTIGNLLKGSYVPTLETQEKVAVALEVTREFILSEVDRINSSPNVIPIRSGHDRDYDQNPLLGEALAYGRRAAKLPREARMIIYQIIAYLEEVEEDRERVAERK